MSNYPIHPAAELFPMMTDVEFEGLKEDIRQHGQRDDIMIWNGQLVDGRNRLRACNELGIEPSFCQMSDELDPVAWVLSHNLHRRHLTTAQRAMVATKLATLRDGEKKDGRTIVLAQSEAAEKLSVSTKSVRRARTVATKATPEVVAAVEAGTMSLNAAVATTKPKASQAEKAEAKAAKEQTKPQKPVMELPQEKKSLTVYQVCHTLYRMSKEKKRRPQIMQIVKAGLHQLTLEERCNVLSSQLLTLSPEDLGKVYDVVDQRQRESNK